LIGTGIISLCVKKESVEGFRGIQVTLN